MTPDQHGYTRCPSCRLWFRTEHIRDTPECGNWAIQRVIIETRVAYPRAFHLPECTAEDGDDCDCTDKARARLGGDR